MSAHPGNSEVRYKGCWIQTYYGHWWTVTPATQPEYLVIDHAGRRTTVSATLDGARAWIDKRNGGTRR